MNIVIAMDWSEYYLLKYLPNIIILLIIFIPLLILIEAYRKR